MNTLLHTCCAPCAIYCVDSLRQEGIQPTSYWFNPNIHPYTEYRSRKTTLEEYAKSIQLPLIIDNTYGLRSFVRAVIDDLEHRCFYCYQVRLEQTARYAAEHHFDSFSTTLLVSPYQKHDALIAAGEAARPGNTMCLFYTGIFVLDFTRGKNKPKRLTYIVKNIAAVSSAKKNAIVGNRSKKKKNGSNPFLHLCLIVFLQVQSGIFFYLSHIPAKGKTIDNF